MPRLEANSPLPPLTGGAEGDFTTTSGCCGNTKYSYDNGEFATPRPPDAFFILTVTRYDDPSDSSDAEAEIRFFDGVNLLGLIGNTVIPDTPANNTIDAAYNLSLAIDNAFGPPFTGVVWNNNNTVTVYVNQVLAPWLCGLSPLIATFPPSAGGTFTITSTTVTCP